MTARTLSTRALNRALLARQLLLERSTLSVRAAVERIAGLQTQYAPSAYIGLWSRLHAFERSGLTAALEQRQVVQATLMRATIHVVSAADYRLFAAGVRAARQALWQAIARSRDIDIAPEKLAATVRALLAGGPLRRAQLTAALEDAGYDKAVWPAVGLWVDLVRVPPSGTWERRRADLYGLAEDWLPAADTTEAAGLEHLVQRYLQGFGPAAVSDIASWAGVSVPVVRGVLERLRLRRFRDERGGELLDVLRAPLPDPDTPAPVRFLPTWDATLLVHARRTQILPEQYRGLVFSTKTPHSVPTFLIDGAVAGTWRYQDAHVHLEPFGTLAPADRQALEDEAQRLAVFHQDRTQAQAARR